MLLSVVAFIPCANLSARNIGGADASDIDIIMEKIRDLNVYSPQDSIIENYIKGMGADGSWADINYKDESKAWEPQIHYYRLLPMSYAYISPQNTYYKNNDLYEKIVLGIHYWLEINPRSGNWYHNQINEPELFGLILISMRGGDQKLPLDLEKKIIERWRNNGSNPEKESGANRAEVALHWMFFACLTDDKQLLATALNYIFEPVKYTSEEGLQIDGSYLYHGPQLYIGGYGEVFLESVLQAAVCVNKTLFALSEEKIEILRSFVLNTYASVLRGGFINWNSIGRQLSRPDFLKYSERRIPIFEMMKVIDEEYSISYDNVLKRLLGITRPEDNVNPYHAHYYRGDFTIHIRPNYSFSTRLVSKRTCRQESLNGENILGYFLSDGSTVISRTGDEYLDLMPMWDWNKIPGVTAPILDKVPTIPEMSTYGSSEFAGGVSDSIYGCTAYNYFDDYNDINTGAFKGYFFFDNEIVCLGAGITSTHDKVLTTVDQCWGKERFSMGGENGFELKEDDVSLSMTSGCSWVLHNNIGYYFPGNQHILIENKYKEGNWRWISTMWEDKKIRGKVFTLGIEHSNPVKERNYAYYIIPGATEQSLADYVKDKEVEILTNTDSVQIVYNKEVKLYECLFYRACTYRGETEITSLQPCAMLIREVSDGFIIHLADPVQSSICMGIGIKGKGMREMEFKTCDFSDIEHQYAGMTNVIKIPKNPTSINDKCGKIDYTFSNGSNIIKLDKHYNGCYTLAGLDGIIVGSGVINSDIIPFDFNFKGLFLLNIYLEGNRVLKRKVIIK